MLREWMFAAAILTLPTYALAQVRGGVQSGEPRSGVQSGEPRSGVQSGEPRAGVQGAGGRAGGGAGGATGRVFTPDVPGTPAQPADRARVVSGQTVPGQNLVLFAIVRKRTLFERAFAPAF